MTIDNETTLRVGGFPVNFNTGNLRRLFDPFGDIVSVNICVDRRNRANPYGFVTFKTYRSAANAINDMDGRTVYGQVIRVTEEKPNAGGPGFERAWDRDGRDNDRGRERERERGRERHIDVRGDRSRDHERFRDNDHDRATDEFRNRDRDQDVHDRGLNSGRGDREIERKNGQSFVEMDRDKRSRNQNGSIATDGRSRDVLSDSNDDLLEEKLQRSNQRLEELKREVQQLEERFNESRHKVSALQLKSKRLEVSLINAKKTSSYRKTQLTKLHKGFMQVRESTKMVERSKEELQSLVNMALSEDIDTIDRIEANGNA